MFKAIELLCVAAVIAGIVAKNLVTTGNPSAGAWANACGLFFLASAAVGVAEVLRLFAEGGQSWREIISRR